MDVGYSPKLEQYDPGLAHSLKYNIAKFSAFKESSFKDQLEAALTKNGKIVPWSDFKKKAQALHVDYHERWLKTEYHHTVATANMAGKWKDFERNKDLYPNIKYVTAGDKRVRDKHAQWDGLVLPMEHSFWKKNLPPNDWGCRCDVFQTDEEVSKDIPSAAPKEGFDNNPAVSGEVFSEIPYEKGMSENTVKEAESLAKELFRMTPIQKEFIKAQRLKIRKYGELQLLKEQIKVNKKSVSFNKTSFKEFANQPFKFEVEKLDILKNISKLLKESKYLGYRNMDNPMIIKSHIYEILVNNEPCWIVVRERKTGEKIFYSISDSPKIALGLNKE